MARRERVVNNSRESTPSLSTMESLPFCLECSNYRGCIATLAANAHVLKGKRVKRFPLPHATRAGLLGSETRVRSFPAYAVPTVARRGWEKRVTRISHWLPSPSSRLAHPTRLPHTRALLGQLFFFLFGCCRWKKTIRVARDGVRHGRVRFPRAAPRRSETDSWKRQEKVFTERSETMTVAQLVKRGRVAD